MNQPVSQERRPLEVGAAPVTIEELAQLSQRARLVALSADARTRMTKSRELLSKLIAERVEIYGVTTGFGDSCENAVEQVHRHGLAQNLVRYHGCGVGPSLDPSESRAVVATRLITLAKGYCGCRPEVAEQLVQLLNHDITPIIPARGSVGASGDLTPLSYVAAVLSGERQVHFRGEVREASVALSEVGITPLELHPKESLSLMNGTSAMTGIAALCFLRASRLARWACLLTAAASDAIGGQVEHFHDRIFELKPHPGQRQAATWIRGDVEARRNASARIQDRYSVRCAPHVIGVLLDFLPIYRQTIEAEINGIDDNPILDASSGEVFHGGNFYGGHICAVMDSMKASVANIADLLDRQLLLCCHPASSNGLPANLVPPGSGPAHHGFKAMQITTSALAAEAAKLSMPASVFSRSTENHNQDKVSMGTIAARDCASILEMAEHVAAINTLAMVQAGELRGIEECGPGLQRLTAHVRKRVARVDFDRALDHDIALVLEDFREGRLPVGEAIA